MLVAKWGNSLAIRLPAAVVEALELKEGDEIEIHVADARELAVARKPGRDGIAEPASRLPRSPACPISNSTGTRRMPGSFFDTNVLIYIASGDP